MTYTIEQLKEITIKIDNTEHLCDIVDVIHIDNHPAAFIEMDEDELQDYLQTNIHEHEVIYYHVAMDFLKEYDLPLTTSMELAHDRGITADNINSELLATLLVQHLASEELSNIDLRG